MIKMDGKTEEKWEGAPRTAAVLFAWLFLLLTVFGAGRLKPAAIPVEPAAVTEPAPIDRLKPEPEKPKAPEYAPFVSQELKDAWEANNDVVGWLIVDGCEIDNRVFQGKDNDVYLRKDENGKKDIWGCYFLDYKNRQDEEKFNDRVQIIYGHSYKDVVEDDKFSKLKRYQKKSFALEHPTIYFSTLNQMYEWRVFACTNIPITYDYIDVNPVDVKFERIILNYILKKSMVDFGVEVSGKDKILILSTCTADDKVRFVLAAKLVGPVSLPPKDE